jgi:uncharacterized protein (TIGR00255 family)
MIKSMTAFARAAHTRAELTAEVTIRSYNSRHLDCALHLPESCLGFEDKLKKIIGQQHDRGRVEVRINLIDTSQDQAHFEVDLPRAQAFYQALDTLKTHLDLAEEISVDTLLSARDIVVAAPKQVDESLLQTVILTAVEKASLALVKMRCQEGENLYQELVRRMDTIEGSMADLEKEAAVIPGIYKEKLMERLATLTADGVEVDRLRLAQEAAIWADKSDVSEEIARLASHIKLFREVMADEKSQGRKLNFLLQEFNREFNTIGSKAGNPALSHMVVDLKSELEKIREQVQNIE